MAKPTYLRVGKVAALFGLSNQQIGNLIRSGQLESYRLHPNGWHRVSRKSVEKLARERGVDLDWDVIKNGKSRF